MTYKAEIKNELKELGSKLPVTPFENVYTVPDGYFEGFASQLVARIKAMETGDVKEELRLLSPILNALSKETPFTIPAGYFNGLEDRLMNGVYENAISRTATEELEILSPLLKNIKNKNPYSVPQGYFENLSVPAAEKTKVISLSSRRWMRIAAAAIVIGIIAVSGVVLISRENISVDKNPEAWVKKSLKKVSTQKIDEFVKMAEPGKELEGAVASSGKPEEIKELVRDIPENEIQNFLDDAKALEEEPAQTSMN